MLINLKNIQKTYNTKTGVSFRAISNVSLSFDESGMVFLIGKSGSGKTTLLNLIGGLDTIDSGSVYIGGKNLSRLSSSEVDRFRNTMVGFVFQEFNLIDYMTVYENVKLALDMQSDKDLGKIDAALDKVNLTDKRDEKVKNLSGGQRQRVGIARAIVKNPDIILADEPTGALDHATGEEIMGIFKQLSKDKLVIMVSHDAEKAVMYADRIVEMKDGTVYRDVRRKKAGEKIDLSQINITSNTLIRLEKGVTLKDSDAQQINEILNEKGRKAYVNVDTNANKMKALFPNLREAVDSGLPQDEDEGQDGQADTLQEKGNFIPYKPTDTEVKKISFIKSKLPTKNALKIGVKNLNLKKGKMIATIVIAVIAFILFGASISFYNFDLDRAYANTIRKGDYNSIIATNAAGGNYHIKETDIKKLKAANPRINVLNQYRVGFDSTHYKMFSFRFNGFVETDDARDADIEMLAGSSVPTDHKSIIISQAMARQALRREYFAGAKDYDDLIGQKISLTGLDKHYRDYTICGIFKTDLEKYKADKDDTRFYDDIQNYIEGVMIVKTGFKEALAADCLTDAQSFLSLLSFTGRYQNNQYVEIIPNNADLCRQLGIGVDYNISLYSTDNPLNYDLFDLKENQIIVSESILQSFGISVPPEDEAQYDRKADKPNIGEDDKNDFSPVWFSPVWGEITVENFNNDKNRSFMVSRGNTPFYFSSEVEIVGVVQRGTADVIIMNSDVMQKMIIDQMYTSKVMLVLSGNNKTDTNLVKYLSANGFAMESDFARGYHSLLGVVSTLYKVIIAFALLLCLLVVILLFTFISTSIKLTRKQIGILRALGARKIDTFKIYALEGIVIGLMSFGITLALLLIFAPIVNLIISASMAYYFSVLTIGFKDIAAVFILMTAVTAISILIPLRKFNKITPIKAIVEKE